MYVAELTTLGYGLPLWSPSPTETGQVRIGDVGRIKNGAFYRVFNVTRPANHPLNQRYGVPDGFEVLVYDKKLKQKRKNHVPAVLCSNRASKIEIDAHAES